MVGDPVQAARAETIGLVHRVVPDDKINEEVQTLAARPSDGAAGCTGDDQARSAPGPGQ